MKRACVKHKVNFVRVQTILKAGSFQRNDTGLKAGALENDLAHSSPGLKAQGFSEQDYKIT